MQFKCLVVDDEPLARRLIGTHIEKLSFFSEVVYCKNAIEALEVLRKEYFDLLLLDVQMPELNGIAFVKSLSQPPKVILTTAFRDYAIDAFDLDVIDYLLKPISFERFVKAVNKFIERVKAPSISSNLVVPQNGIITIRSERKMVRVPVAEIYFIESIKDYIKVHTAKSFIITKESISAMHLRLESYQFIRIHRSFLVAINKIQAFNHEFVEILGKQLPYGRTYRQSALDQLDIY